MPRLLRSAFAEGYLAQETKDFQMTATVSYADGAAIRDHYQRMLNCWGDAVAYAECFTPGADYIIADGMIEHG